MDYLAVVCPSMSVRPSVCSMPLTQILELEHEQEMPCQKSNPLVGVVVRPTDVAETRGCPVQDGCIIWRPFVRLSVCLSVPCPRLKTMHLGLSMVTIEHEQEMPC